MGWGAETEADRKTHRQTDRNTDRDREGMIQSQRLRLAERQRMDVYKRPRTFSVLTKPSHGSLP